MKIPLIVIIASLAGFSGAWANTAQEILEQHERAKAEALQGYLKANPEATDRPEAIEHLVAALSILGDNDAVVPLLEERYNGLVKEDEPNLQIILGTLVPQLIESFKAGGGKEKALEFLDRVAKDLEPVATADPRIESYLAQLRGQLNVPGVGDSMDIKFTATDGSEVDLTAMTGKVVLVDFWATWCGPCIAEMPNVIKAYNEFHDDGFEVVGISLDQNQSDLDRYVEENKMPWPQYFDGKGWGNEIAGKFGIQGIPATFLIGKSGKIEATNLRGDALEKKVSELLEES